MFVVFGNPTVLEIHRVHDEEREIQRGCCEATRTDEEDEDGAKERAARPDIASLLVGIQGGG